MEVLLFFVGTAGDAEIPEPGLDGGHVNRKGWAWDRSGAQSQRSFPSLSYHLSPWPPLSATTRESWEQLCWSPMLGGRGFWAEIERRSPRASVFGLKSFNRRSGKREAMTQPGRPPAGSSCKAEFQFPSPQQDLLLPQETLPWCLKLRRDSDLWSHCVPFFPNNFDSLKLLIGRTFCLMSVSSSELKALQSRDVLVNPCIPVPSTVLHTQLVLHWYLLTESIPCEGEGRHSWAHVL